MADKLDEIIENLAHAPKPESEEPGDEVTADELGVAGIITDSLGHTWTTADLDLSTMMFSSPLDVTLVDPNDAKNFTIEFARLDRDEVSSKRALGFIPVLRKEVGRLQFDPSAPDFHKGGDEPYIAEGMVAMKIPTIMSDRLNAEKKKLADAPIHAIYPKGKPKIKRLSTKYGEVETATTSGRSGITPRAAMAQSPHPTEAEATHTNVRATPRKAR